jgi:hypothetical protein
MTRRHRLLGQALARRFPEIPKIQSYFAELVDDYRRVRELRVAQQLRGQCRLPAAAKSAHDIHRGRHWLNPRLKPRFHGLEAD